MKKALIILACCFVVSCSSTQKEFLVDAAKDIVKIGVSEVINKNPDTLGTFNRVAERLQEISQSEELDAGYVESELNNVVVSSDYKNAKTILEATKLVLDYYKNKDAQEDSTSKEKSEILENISEGVSSACESYVESIKK